MAWSCLPRAAAQRVAASVLACRNSRLEVILIIMLSIKAIDVGGRSRLFRSGALEVGRVIDTAGALPLGGLRVRAQGTRPIHYAIGGVGGDDLVRRLTVFHPSI